MHHILILNYRIDKKNFYSPIFNVYSHSVIPPFYFFFLSLVLYLSNLYYLSLSPFSLLSRPDLSWYIYMVWYLALSPPFLPFSITWTFFWYFHYFFIHTFSFFLLFYYCVVHFIFRFFIYCFFLPLIFSLLFQKKTITL